jgi:hypothetical protein
MSDLNQLTDAELSAAFSVEVNGRYVAPNRCVYLSRAHHERDPLCGGYPVPDFAGSVDIVLTDLERTLFRIERMCQPDAYVVYIELPVGTYVKGYDERLSKAACIALIMAARAEKEGAK